MYVLREAVTPPSTAVPTSSGKFLGSCPAMQVLSLYNKSAFLASMVSLVIRVAMQERAWQEQDEYDASSADHIPSSRQTSQGTLRRRGELGKELGNC